MSLVIFPFSEYCINPWEALGGEEGCRSVKCYKFSLNVIKILNVIKKMLLNVIKNGPKCNKGPKCNTDWVLNVLQVWS